MASNFLLSFLSIHAIILACFCFLFVCFFRGSIQNSTDCLSRTDPLWVSKKKYKKKFWFELIFFFLFLLFLFLYWYGSCFSKHLPWHNCTGWQGIKHQVTYSQNVNWLSVDPPRIPASLTLTTTCLSVCAWPFALPANTTQRPSPHSRRRCSHHSQTSCSKMCRVGWHCHGWFN